MMSAQLNLPKSSIHRIVKIDLGLYPYKLQIKQSLTDYDCARRLEFAHWMLGRLERTPALLDLIWFSDESHFHLDGHVNSQNCRYWGKESPTEVVARPLHSKKVPVWCALSSQGIIGPFFFEEDDTTVTVNGKRYRSMLETFFVPELKRLAGNELSRQWFQQDGATAHTANNTLTFIRSEFANRIISLRTDNVWPPYSPDLNPSDFYLWGYLKDCVYKDPKPTDLVQLKANISTHVRRISMEILQKIT